jgi:hypothetical protein
MTRTADCHPDRPHYAKGLCKKCYRSERFGAAYQRARYGKKLKMYRAKYEASPEARARQQRYYQVRKAIGQVLGVPSPKLSAVFANPEQVAKLRTALLASDPTLIKVWWDLTTEQQALIQ